MAALKKTFTVGQLNDYVGGLLGNDPMLRNIRVTGEVSNFRITASGHGYFALKDDRALVRCAMFRSSLEQLSLLPKDGDMVTAFGSVGLYGADGQYQLYVKQLELAGEGELFVRFERLKEELNSRGWFDPAVKKPLPLLPQKVGVVTSETGAVIHDIMNVARRRFPGFSLVLAPAAVQGAEAAPQIVEAIGLLDERKDVDVIIVARGGGSVEDLWPFNDERVAKAIYDCKTPVVSAVGHETDFTIADFVADLRAPTPSAAAEQVFPRKQDLEYTQFTLMRRIEAALQRRMDEKTAGLKGAAAVLRARHPLRQVEQEEQRLDNAVSRTLVWSKTELEKRRLALTGAGARLDGVSPLAAMGRGFAWVTCQGASVTKAAQLQEGQKIELRFQDGSAAAKIETVHGKG